MSRALPALILRLLASRVVLAGLQALQVFASYAARIVAHADRVAPAAQHDPAALDADEASMFERVTHSSQTGAASYCGNVMPPLHSSRWKDVDCPDCLRMYHGKERPS